MLDPLDGFVDRSVGRNALEIAELEDSGAECDQNNAIKGGGIAPGEFPDQEIKLSLKAQAAKNDIAGEGDIASGEGMTQGEQGVGGVGLVFDPGKDIEGGAASWRNWPHPGAGHRHRKIVLALMLQCFSSIFAWTF